MGLLNRGRAGQRCCRASGEIPHIPWALLLSPRELDEMCSKVFPVQEKLPWSFDNQSLGWEGASRKGGIRKFSYIVIIWMWPGSLGRLWRLRLAHKEPFLLSYTIFRVLGCSPIKQFFKCPKSCPRWSRKAGGRGASVHTLPTAFFTPASEPGLFPGSLRRTHL